MAGNTGIQKNMIVYKFGGASVNSPEGVRNLCAIVRECKEKSLLVIVSAMGKTTNALENVLERVAAGDRAGALERLAAIEAWHASITGPLFGANGTSAAVARIWEEARAVVTAYSALQHPVGGELYDIMYDDLVSFGELASTTIVSAYLASAGVPNRWIDMRRCLVTDARHRAADVLMDESAPLLRAATEGPGVFVSQGFIGATRQGQTTTLGREGSDYSAAVAANLLDAESVTIWKDVPGILNADPRLFPDTLLIPTLTYLDAVELAYSGAQVIHPKTIKPLQNKQIPLYVRPFMDHTAPGSVIRGEMTGRIEVPILILKANQVLVSIRPKDFSFVLEERLMEILSAFDRNGIKLNLIQTSAVNLSLCVDAGRDLPGVIAELSHDYRVVYNDGLELLTVRGYTPELYARHAEADGVLLSQRTRRIVRIVRPADKTRTGN